MVCSCRGFWLLTQPNCVLLLRFELKLNMKIVIFRGSQTLIKSTNNALSAPTIISMVIYSWFIQIVWLNGWIVDIERFNRLLVGIMNVCCSFSTVLVVKVICGPKSQITFGWFHFVVVFFSLGNILCIYRWKMRTQKGKKIDRINN